MRKYYIGIGIFLLSFTLNAHKLKIGVSPYDPPFVIQTTHQDFTGFDIAMMSYVCKHINYQCQFLPIRRDLLIHAVSKGQVDVAVSNLTNNKSYYGKVLYSLPYLTTSTHIIGLANQLKANFNLSLLNNTHIGIADHDYVGEIKGLNVIKPKIEFFSQDDLMIAALTDGKIQFALVDAYTAVYWEKSSSGLIKDYGCPKKFAWTSNIVIKPNAIFLQKKINQALIDYQNSPQFLKDYDQHLFNFKSKNELHY